MEDRVAAVFKGTTVFISGGTGFIGKVLIEKLLRCCQVKQIFVLIRRKKGMSINERINHMFKNPLYDTLRERDPEAFKKCTGMSGDVCEPNLGMSQYFRNLVINEADFIFHSAATTRFDDTVKYAVTMNTRGTKFMLDLAKECKKLKLFVHLSTAYAFPQEKVLGERRYEPPANPHSVIESLEWIKDDASDKLTREILQNTPNTYTFSKALAEELVNEQVGKLPVLILRPSLVVPIFDSPLKGWVNNLQGPMGLFVGAGKGVIRSMYMNPNAYANLIPVDAVVNIILLMTREKLTKKLDGHIYNAVVPKEDNNRTWQEIIDTGRKIVEEEVPFNIVLWYPGGSIQTNKYVHLFNFYMFQLIPAIFVDILLYILGYDPILYTSQRRIQKAASMFEFYTGRSWDFDNSAEMVRDGMNEIETKLYRIDSKNFDVHDYLVNCMMTVKRVNLHEPLEYLPKAQRNLKILYYVDRFCKGMFFVMVFYYIFKLVVHLMS